MVGSLGRQGEPGFILWSAVPRSGVPEYSYVINLGSWVGKWGSEA
jgi:hypothetical protein